MKPSMSMFLSKADYDKAKAKWDAEKAATRFEVECEDGIWKVFSHVTKNGTTYKNWVASGVSKEDAERKRRIAEIAMWG